MSDQAPTGTEVAGAFAAFFHGGQGPTHSEISRILVSSGMDDRYVYDPDGQGLNKETRILNAFSQARRQPATARRLVEDLLASLRLKELVGLPADQRSEDENKLRAALLREHFTLTDDGQLRTADDIDLSTGGRKALDEQIARLRLAHDDPALMIGTTKDLLEAVGKFVLEESAMPARKGADFGEIITLARERLEIKPSQADSSVAGFETIRRIHQSAWQIAESVNDLRNLQGTGHGRTLPTGISAELARLVIREACQVAEYMLTLLDRRYGERP